MWPFAAWGMVIVVLYAVAYKALSNVSGPIGTLNLVNFVAVRYQRVFFYAQVRGCVAVAVAVCSLLLCTSAAPASFLPLCSPPHTFAPDACLSPGCCCSHADVPDWLWCLRSRREGCRDTHTHALAGCIAPA